ncbi:MAG: NAD(P)/FAD-dependent oxidoreductase [Spirochaetales bacterium]|nr:NAD(P)/FAD-dependent oxidoreductase [Spirochaetales bacterium]
MKSVPDRVVKTLEKKGLTGIAVTLEEESLCLKGMVKNHDDWLKAGYTAAAFPCREVINDLAIQGLEPEKDRLPALSDSLLEGRHFDAVVIGGGVIGCAAARELTRWDISVALLEKDGDVSCHASGRNDGMVHPGFAAHPGTKKATYNVRGNKLYTRVSEDLGVPLVRCGSMLLLKNPLYILLIPYFFLRARQNGVEGCRFIERRKVFQLEKQVTRKQWGAFSFPTAGVMSPYRTAIAYAENAVQNGAEVFLDTRVRGFRLEPSKPGKTRLTAVETNRGTFTASVVINAAGIWADRIAQYAGDRFFSLHYRKGVDCILDKKTGALQQRATGMPELFQLRAKTKGGGIVPTTEGNLLIGPTAEEIPYREEYSTSQTDIDALMSRLNLNRALKKEDIITYFAGVRACTWKEDFIIEPSRKVDNLIHAAGIQSPGFASAPAIAEDVAAFAVEALKLQRTVMENRCFNPRREAPVNPRNLSPQERTKLIQSDPAYGRVICRCEGVSEGEVRDALRSSVPAMTLDGIKRRTRAGMGRCHGGFCTPRILEIMSAELKEPMERLTKRGAGSLFFTGLTKETEPKKAVKGGEA